MVLGSLNNYASFLTCFVLLEFVHFSSDYDERTRSLDSSGVFFCNFF